MDRVPRPQIAWGIPDGSRRQQVSGVSERVLPRLLHRMLGTTRSLGIGMSGGMLHGTRTKAERPVTGLSRATFSDTLATVWIRDSQV